MKTPVWCRTQASEIGDACPEVVDQLLEVNALYRLRAAQGVLGLRRKYGDTRLEAACARAIAVGDPPYCTIKSILVTGTETDPEPETSGDAGAAAFLHGPQGLSGSVAPGHAGGRPRRPGEVGGRRHLGESLHRPAVPGRRRRRPRLYRRGGLHCRPRSPARRRGTSNCQRRTAARNFRGPGRRAANGRGDLRRTYAGRAPKGSGGRCPTESGHVPHGVRPRSRASGARPSR